MNDVMNYLRNTAGLKTTTAAVTQVVKPVEAVLDSAAQPAAVTSAVSDMLSQNIELEAIHVLHGWTETDDLDEGETLADRLMGSIVSLADEDQDGELDDEEQDLIEVALNAIFDYLLTKGITEDDASLLLNDWDKDAAERIKDQLVEALPSDADEVLTDIDDFVFDESAQEDALDAALDAAYKMKLAVRGGRKMRVRKRISGTVRRTAKQKMAMMKASRKAHNAQATLKRAKSMKVRTRLGL